MIGSPDLGYVLGVPVLNSVSCRVVGLVTMVPPTQTRITSNLADGMPLPIRTSLALRSSVMVKPLLRKEKDANDDEHVDHDNRRSDAGGDRWPWFVDLSNGCDAAQCEEHSQEPQHRVHAISFSIESRRT